MPPECGGAPTEAAGSIGSGDGAGELPQMPPAVGAELERIRRHRWQGRPCWGGAHAPPFPLYQSLITRNLSYLSVIQCSFALEKENFLLYLLWTITFFPVFIISTLIFLR